MMDPALAREIAHALAAVFPGQWGDLSHVSGRVLQEHAGSRATFELELDLRGRTETMIAKQYATDRADVHERTSKLWDVGFTGLPRPVVYLRELNVWLQEKAAGTTAQEALLSGDPATGRLAAERSADWLRQFQATPADGLPVLTAREYLNDLERWGGRLARRLEGAGERVERLLGRLRKEAGELADLPNHPYHGSYGPGHVLLSREPAVILDWDGYSAADPCRDTGRYLAATRRLAVARLGDIRALDQAAEAFTSRLVEGRPWALRNLRFYEAAACLQLAKYGLSHPVKHWERKSLAMLDEGNSVFEERRYAAA